MFPVGGDQYRHLTDARHRQGLVRLESDLLPGLDIAHAHAHSTPDLAGDLADRLLQSLHRFVLLQIKERPDSPNRGFGLPRRAAHPRRTLPRGRFPAGASYVRRHQTLSTSYRTAADAVNPGACLTTSGTARSRAR